MDSCRTLPFKQMIKSKNVIWNSQTMPIVIPTTCSPYLTVKYFDLLHFLSHSAKDHEVRWLRRKNIKCFASSKPLNPIHRKTLTCMVCVM